MPGRGAALDEGVVVRDVVGLAVGLHRGQEQQPELVAGYEPGRDQAPVVGNRDLGGRGRRGRHRPARHHHRVGIGAVAVLGRHLHLDGVRARRQCRLEAGLERVRVREHRVRSVQVRERRVVVRRRLDGDFVHGVEHVRGVGFRTARKGLVQIDRAVVRGVLQRQTAQRRVGGEGDGGIVGDREIGETGDLVISGVLQRVGAGHGLVVADGDGLALRDLGRGLQRNQQAAKREAFERHDACNLEVGAGGGHGEGPVQGGRQELGKVEGLVELQLDRGAVSRHERAIRARRGGVHGGIVGDREIGETGDLVAGVVLQGVGARSGLVVADGDVLALPDLGRGLQGDRQHVLLGCSGDG